MKKQMIRARARALEEELRKKDTTQAEFAEELSMDRKTLRAINRGELVKDDTLIKVANKLRIPVQHLQETTEPSSSKDKTDQNLLHLKTARTSDIKGLLSGAVGLKWRLLLDKIENPLSRDLILDFEKTIARWWLDLNTDAERTLSEQLERLEMGLEFACENTLKELKDRSIAILGGEYLYW